MHFLLVINADNDAAAAVAAETAAWLTAEGHTVETSHHLDQAVVGDDGSSAPPDKIAARADLVVSLGGDGTMLRAVEIASPHGVPVAGVDLGRLGYLSEIAPRDVHSTLERFIAGDCDVDERMTLEVVLDEPGMAPRTVFPSALNEAVLERTLPGHTVRISVSIGGVPFTTYAADGLLVCSSSGSTAYNLSVRGPILSPLLAALVVTPISPHTLFDRALVLEPREEVRLEVAGPRPAVLVVDGIRLGILDPGTAVVCRPGPFPARLATFTRRNFHSIVKAKFGLTDR